MGETLDCVLSYPPTGHEIKIMIAIIVIGPGSKGTETHLVSGDVNSLISAEQDRMSRIDSSWFQSNAECTALYATRNSETRAFWVGIYGPSPVSKDGRSGYLIGFGIHIPHDKAPLDFASLSHLLLKGWDSLQKHVEKYKKNPAAFSLSDITPTTLSISLDEIDNIRNTISQSTMADSYKTINDHDSWLDTQLFDPPRMEEICRKLYLIPPGIKNIILSRENEKINKTESNKNMEKKNMNDEKSINKFDREGGFNIYGDVNLSIIYEILTEILSIKDNISEISGKIKYISDVSRKQSKKNNILIMLNLIIILLLLYMAGVFNITEFHK